MKKCIICRELKSEDKFNEEHIIEDSLGGKIKIYDVCKECNSKLGTKIDACLTNNFISELYRYDFKIKGKSGNLPNPFKQGTLVGEEGRTVVCDEELKPKLRTYVEQDYDNNKIIVSAENEEEAYRIIRKIMKRRGKNNITDEEISNMIIEKKNQQFRPQVKFNKELDFNLIGLAIIKIAYEFSYRWLGKEYLNDLQSNKLSSMLLTYIREDKVSNIEGSIGNIPESLSGGLKKELIATLFNKDLSEIDLNKLHIVLLQVSNGKLYCNVSIFGTFNYWVLISNEANNYQNINKFFIAFADTGHFLEI